MFNLQSLWHAYTHEYANLSFGLCWKCNNVREHCWSGVAIQHLFRHGERVEVCQHLQHGRSSEEVPVQHHRSSGGSHPSALYVLHQRAHQGRALAALRSQARCMSSPFTRKTLCCLFLPVWPKKPKLFQFKLFWFALLIMKFIYWRFTFDILCK